MDDSETYMNAQLVKTDTQSAPEDGLTSTYTLLGFRKDNLRIDDYADRPTALGSAEQPVTSQAAVHEQQSKAKIRNRSYRQICLICLVTSALTVMVAGLSIHVSQVRSCNITADQSCNELNSTLQYKLSALNSNFSVHKRLYTDLRHQFTEMETKFRSVNQSKAQICEWLTSRREQTCSENWVTNKDRCYYVSASETFLQKASQECSNRDSRLLEINSSDEASFVSRNIMSTNRMYWVGKCENRNVSFGLLHKDSIETSVCSQCDPTAVRRRYPCDRDWSFICEKSAPVFPDVPEQIQGLCQQPVE